MKFFSRTKKRWDLKLFIIILIFIILFLTYILFYTYNVFLTPKINEYSYNIINKFNYEIITNCLSDDLLKRINLDDILIITKNKEGEILLVDFDMKKSYEINNKIAKILTEKLSAIESGQVLDNNLNIKASKEGFQLNVPLFIGSNYTIISNLGPKIPIKISFISRLKTNL